MGIYYYRERFYFCRIGKFISEDPIRFKAGDVNLYRYVKNSLVMFKDPFGLVCGGSGWQDEIWSDKGLGWDFTECCQGYDDCYLNGPEGTGANCEDKDRREEERKECDDKFYNCMENECLSAPTKATMENCRMNRNINYFFVRTFGGNYYGKDVD
ncbi:MAG: hypothetical protein GF350_09675 [Chitinivibrionales bacterium]|nr:hypothetical protein [Chitinivibrionales bacterium]